MNGESPGAISAKLQREADGLGPDPDLVRRILHGEEEYIFHGPLPRAGQVLSCEAKVTDTYEKPGKRGGSMRFGVVVTEFRDEQGTLVAEARSTLVETEKAPKKKDEG